MTAKTYEFCSVGVEAIDAYISNWHKPNAVISWPCLFSSPGWLKPWWNIFGPRVDLSLIVIRKAADVIGVAPLFLEMGQGRFVGSPDVCDYLDFAILPGKESVFFSALFNYLRDQNISHLDLQPLHPESAVVTILPGLAESLSCSVQFEANEPVFEMALPSTWDGYLQMLTGKQRHEVRRKLRRLEDAGNFAFQTVTDSRDVPGAMGKFHALFHSNRPDKSAFMTDQMVGYFNALAASLAKAGVLRLSFLKLDGLTAAAVMCFDYRSTVYLYNNGYDDQFSHLSVGMLSKILSIKDSIRMGRQTYSFLKGNEGYKQHIGGKKVPLYRCLIDLA